MLFILSEDWQEGISDLSERLINELRTSKVLWFVSGGSNISASVEIASKIPSDLTHNLTVMLVDERYGEVGHPDSNWTKLIDAGFKADEATLTPVIEQGLNFEATTERYNSIVNQAFQENPVVIAQIGMGDDGHVAGILPNSTATSEESALVTGYVSEPFQRITLTFPALRKLNAAYTFAFGESKKLPLISLRDEKLSRAKQPAQILKEIPDSYVYNDQLGPAK